MGINVYFSDIEATQVLQILCLWQKENPVVGLVLAPMIVRLRQKLIDRGVLVI